MPEVQTALATFHDTLAVIKIEINPMWILCKNESIVDIIKNRQMISNIRKSKYPIRLKRIEGNTIEVNEERDLLGYGVVYYNAQITANVLSFFNMAKKFKSLIYDNNKKDAFIVTREDGSTFEFVPSYKGLYYYDFNNSVKRQKGLEKNKHTMVIDTVDELKRNFMKRENERADVARRMYVTLGRPSQGVFESIIRIGSIINNPVTIIDYQNALRLYGKDLGSIKGKTTRTKPQHV